jgi:hypothetical protein
MNRPDLGLNLCIFTLSVCAIINAATFMADVPEFLAAVPFLLLFTAMYCGLPPAVRSISFRNDPIRLCTRRGIAALGGCILLLYAAVVFVHMYKATGGATGVAMANGSYVYMFKSRILRPITLAEYKMFPRLVRLASAWTAVMATFCILMFSGNPTKNEWT